jgi:site-specific recombinase XerD
MLRGEISKNGENARIPLNDDAADIFSSWREQSPDTGDDDLIFPSPKTGERLHNARRSWEAILREADIQKFRWHDMRHDFASQLVMRGVDLTVVCELMNHSNLKLTMRYAHLAPKQKLDAVQALNRRTKGDKIIGRIRNVQNS